MSNDTDQERLILSLIEEGYAVDKSRNLVRPYIRDSHKAFDVHKHAIEHGYMMTGFKNLGRDEEFLGYCRLHPVSDAGLTFVNDDSEQ